MTTIDPRLVQVFVEHLGTKPEDVTREATFDSLGADSLDKLELIMAAEEEFAVTIDDKLAEGWTTVAEVDDHLKSVVGEGD